MTTLPPGARALLQNARGAINPTAEDEQRIATRLAAALNPIDSLDTHPSTSVAPPPTLGSLPQAPASIPLSAGISSRGAWLRHARLVSLGIVAGGLAGYQFGFSRGAQRINSSTLPAPEVRIEASPLEVPRADNSILNPLPEDPITVPDDAPQNPVAHTAKSRASAQVSARVSDDEVYQVQRVERALRQGDAALALSLLQDLQASFPQGRLHQERTAARCLAHCMQNQAVGERELQSFERQYPNSVHLNRLRQACTKK